MVENAFGHGIEPLAKGGIITLEALYTEDSVELKVSDNGLGMSEETVRAIKEGHSGGVGLKLTMERLGIHYSHPDVFSIESKEGQGTTVTIKIPLTKEETE